MKLKGGLILTCFNQATMNRGLSMFQFWGKERCNEDAQHKSMFEI